MKTKKINIFGKANGAWHYICSTTQSKTCKEAVSRFLELKAKYPMSYNDISGKYTDFRAWFDREAR